MKKFTILTFALLSPALVIAQSPSTSSSTSRTSSADMATTSYGYFASQNAAPDGYRGMICRASACGGSIDIIPTEGSEIGDPEELIDEPDCNISNLRIEFIRHTSVNGSRGLRLNVNFQTPPTQPGSHEPETHLFGQTFDLDAIERNRRVSYNVAKKGVRIQCRYVDIGRTFLDPFTNSPARRDIPIMKTAEDRNSARDTSNAARGSRENHRPSKGNTGTGAH